MGKPTKPLRKYDERDRGRHEFRREVQKSEKKAYWRYESARVREDDESDFLEELKQFERTLPQRDPFSALETYTRLMIRAANSTSQHSIARVSGPKAIFLKVMHMVFGRKWNGSQTIIVVYHRKLETIFMKVMDMVCGHKGSDAQTTIDTVYNVFKILPRVPSIRKKCLGALYKLCGENNLLPLPLQIDLPHNVADTPYCRGGFADVLKWENRGRMFAIKVLRLHSGSDLRKITRRFYKEAITWKALNHPNVVPLLGIPKDRSRLKFAMVSEWMANGNVNQFVKAHRDANRFKLLGDAANGLIYLHALGMIHGDLKGDNILVDENGCARLADFGLLTIYLDSATSSSDEKGGSSRWMSPELFEPEMFGAKDSRRTKSSDCYALGMVVYEVLTGQAPFSRYNKYAAVGKVLRGERPERPQGPEERWFTDDVWGILWRCWESKPGDRPSIEDVLQHLEEASSSWIPLPPLVEEGPGQPDSPPWTVSEFSNW